MPPPCSKELVQGWAPFHFDFLHPSLTLYAFQFMICPILWNEVQLPNIKIFLKRKWYCPNFGQTFLFFRKASKPRSSEATHLFCRQTRIYCLSRKTIADKYIFLTEIYIFILLSACFLFFLTFEESVLKYDFAAPAPLWREIAFQIAAFEKDAEKTWSCHENEVSNSSGKRKVNCNEKKLPLFRN